MENQEELQLGIGTEEVKKLEPEKVRIEDATIETVGKNNNKKVVCQVKHSQAEGTIQISAVKYENNGKLQSIGLWINKDSAGLLRKDSALAHLMKSVGANNILELKGKEVNTTLDEKGYLTFKAY